MNKKVQKMKISYSILTHNETESLARLIDFIEMYKDKVPVLSPNVAASTPDRPIDIGLSIRLNIGQRKNKPTSTVGMASKKDSIK